MTELHPSERWKISDASERDTPQIRALFLEVFGQEMSQALWHWKYGDDRGFAVIAKRTDNVIAHYGGIKREVSYQGRRQASMQCVDTMVKPTERGTLARKGPYFLVAHAFLNRFIGYNRPYEFGYGFPNKRVMLLGKRVGIQAPIGDVLEPTWTALPASSYHHESFDLDKPQHRTLADQLSADMARAMPGSIVGVRDHAYLKHRYIDNPIHKYQMKLIRDSSDNTVLGIVVFRLETEQVLLLDTIGLPANFPALIEHTRWLCSKLGLNRLVGWITRTHLSLLGDKCNEVHNPEVQIPTSICTDGPSPSSLYDKWFLTAGDTDFK